VLLSATQPTVAHTRTRLGDVVMVLVQKCRARTGGRSRARLPLRRLCGSNSAPALGFSFCKKHVNSIKNHRKIKKIVKSFLFDV
jgi:hypothetical protein